ncbi:hypothetical protein [Mucilaginibacter boryungensis]|uniref:Uncharacterized protein n=1 Tax=Mucilaginibacter boryungensis TaxID=768480 RepID=A0ABR9XNA7_9SPHI|nr:hypothetical protein [Mucilaginibacter boryungensis]MBE9668554.1 hypothetical protein [Mucilaginibacter boryungensis]
MEQIFTMSARSLQYFVIAKRWRADLDFFKVETSFLRQLLNRYISRLQDTEHIGRLIACGSLLDKLEAMEVDDLLAGQLTQLELMAEDIIPEDSESLAATQVKLEYFMSNLVKEFRAAKEQIYRLVLSASISFSQEATT